MAGYVVPNCFGAESGTWFDGRRQSNDDFPLLHGNWNYYHEGTKTRRKSGKYVSVRISLHHWIPDHFNSAHDEFASILELQLLLFVPS
jgi:hypothetical protein